MNWERLLKILNNYEHKFLKRGEVKKITIAKEDTMYCIQIQFNESVKSKTAPLYIFEKIDETEVINFEEEN